MSFALYSALALAAAGAGAALRFRARGRAQADAARRTAAELAQLRRAAEFLEEGLLLVSAEERVVFANPAARALLGAKETIPIAAAPQVEYFAHTESLAAVLRVADAGQSSRGVVEIEGAGRQVLEVTSAPVTGGRLVILRDLGASEAVDRMRRDFVANASHELQTPIAALVGLLDLVETVPQAQRAALLERARRNAEALSSLTRDLLGLARAQDPDWRPTPERVAIGELVGLVLEIHGARAFEKGLELHGSVQPEGLELWVDRLSLQTVLTNLVENAVNYTERGKVAVRVSREPELGAVIEVQDSGPGIDPAIQARIFERFFRGDPARSRASGGTGLGLSIVRNLLRRMGGRIAVSSRPGGGSTFRVELPASPAQPLPGAGQAEFR